MNKSIINPWHWQNQYGFVQANEIRQQREFLICSGQTPNDSEANVLYKNDMRSQINLAFNNVEIVLEEAGWEISDIVHIKYYTTDVDLFLAKSDALMKRLRVAGCQPSSTLLGVTRLAFPDAMIEIEVLAMR